MTESLPSFKACYFCGNANPRGWAIAYAYDAGSDLVCGPVDPEAVFCGYPGVLHGGIQAALLDDVLYWAATLRAGLSSVTLELTTRFRRTARLGQVFTLSARSTAPEGRKIRAEGWLADAEGTVVAEASGLYLLHSREEYEKTVLPWLDFSDCSAEMAARFRAPA